MTEIIKINNRKFRKNKQFEESIEFIKEDNQKLSTEVIIKCCVMAMASMLRALTEYRVEEDESE